MGREEDAAGTRVGIGGICGVRGMIAVLRSLNRSGIRLMGRGGES